MEWKSSTHKQKYDVKFGTKTIKGIPASKLIVVKEQGHSHSISAGVEDDSETEDNGEDEE